jgi:hypothetical protein
MKVHLKSITENSWLVISDTEDSRIGLLTEVRDKYILMISGAKQQFLNRKEVNKFFNEDVFSNIDKTIVKEATDKQYFINGYPVEFDNPHEVFITGNKLPLFSKKQASDVYYSAGYYCLNFPKSWMPAMSPKYSTLQAYEYAGPFKTEMEMKLALVKLRKESKEKHL